MDFCLRVGLADSSDFEPTWEDGGKMGDQSGIEWRMQGLSVDIEAAGERRWMVKL